MIDNIPKRETPRVRGKTTAYHHGDLKSALILAARAALQTSPPEAISLTSLALQLGVSQPAPYRHFDSRNALFNAVAEHGFEQLREALHVAEQAGPAEDALHRLGMAYVDFGRENWGVYKLMFSRRLLAPAAHEGAMARLADASFDLLAGQVTLRVGASRGPRASVAIWAALHGLVTLDAEGLLAGPLDRRLRTEELVAEVLASLESISLGSVSKR